MWRREDGLQTPIIGRALRLDALGNNLNIFENKIELFFLFKI